MTAKEILQNAYSISGQFISDPVGIRLINNAVNLLVHRHESASIIKDVPITVEDKLYTLVDTLGVKRVQKDGSNYKGYKVWGDKLLFDEDGEYILYFVPTPIDVENTSDEPDINASYHPILELYVASRIPRPYDRELEQEFYNLAGEIDLRLERGRQKNINIPKRLWR